MKTNHPLRKFLSGDRPASCSSWQRKLLEAGGWPALRRLEAEGRRSVQGQKGTWYGVPGKL